MALIRRFTTSVLRGVAWILLAFAGLGAFLSMLVPFSPPSSGDTAGAVAGMLMFTAMFGIPGGLLLWRVRTGERERAFEEQLIGLLRVRDRFSIEEIAGKIGRTHLETEGLVMRLAPLHQLDLVYHRPTDEFFHRNRFSEGSRIVQSCAACGASFRSEIILEGENLACQYCGKGL